MSWAIVAVGTVAAVGAGVNAYSQNKRAKAASGGLDEAIAYARRNPGVFGEKLDFEAIDYTPLFREDPGYANIAGDVIGGNQRNLPANLKLAGETNDWITQDAKNRVNAWDPTFGSAFGQQQQNTLSFLRGDIPSEDRDAIVGRRAEQIALGGGGAQAGQTAADLGLTRMDVMARGAENLTNNANLLNIVDPINRRVNPQSMFVDVGQAINSYVAENQFDAQFQQAERNAELAHAAMPDPQKAGLLNLMASRAGIQAANPGVSVLGNAAVAGFTAGAGAYASQQASQSWNQPQQQQQYVYSQPTRPSYASASDQANGIAIMGSGTGSSGGTYNPYTGTDYGQQGGLWSYTGAPKSNPYASAY